MSLRYRSRRYIYIWPSREGAAVIHLLFIASLLLAFARSAALAGDNICYMHFMVFAPSVSHEMKRYRAGAADFCCFSEVIFAHHYYPLPAYFIAPLWPSRSFSSSEAMITAGSRC